MKATGGKSATRRSRAPEAEAAPSGELVWIAVAEIAPSPYQTRQAETPEELAGLADSIRAQGIVQPLAVRRAKPDAPSGLAWELVCGHRRLAAAALAGLEKVPCVARDLDDTAARVANVIENLQRKDLSPMDEADGVAQLTDHEGRTAPEIARMLGVSERWVFRRRKLAAVIPAWRAVIRDKRAGQLFCERLAALPAPLQKRLLKTDAAKTPDADAVGRELWQIGVRAVKDMPWNCAHPEWCKGCPNIVDHTKDGGPEEMGFGWGWERFEHLAFCGDPACQGTKTKEWVKERARWAMHATAEAGWGAVQPVRVKRLYEAPYERKDEMTKTCTVPYLVTEGEDAGKVVWARPEKTPEELAAAAQEKRQKEIPGRREELARVLAVHTLIEEGEGKVNDMRLALELALLYLTPWRKTEYTRDKRMGLLDAHGDRELIKAVIGQVRRNIRPYIDKSRYLKLAEITEGFLAEADALARIFGLGEETIEITARKLQETVDAN